MSSRASVKSPTPGSSSTSGGRATQNLAQELGDQKMKDDSDSEDDTEELKRQLDKTNSDFKAMREIFNQNAAALSELQEQARKNQDLEKEVATLRAAANVISAPVEGRERLKLNTPSTFDGTPGQLKGHLVQVRTYQAFHINTFQNDTERVVHAATFLRGRALAWFEPLQQEWLDNPVEKYSQEVKDIFFSFTGYVKALESLFLDPDERRQAERDLSHLRQTKSATLYAAEFRRLAARLHMTDESKVFAFYQGLKDEVKDEMAKLETPPSFLAYVEHAIKVDNRLYERRKERGEKRQNPNSGRKYQWQPQQKFNNQRNDNRPRNNWNNTRQSTAYGQHSGPMDLSMMTKPNNKKPWNPKCYNCNKQGHIAKDCGQPKKFPWRPVAERPRQVNTIAKAPHASQSWTGCYDDNCRIHLEDKEMSGHYPRDSNPGRSGYDMTIPDTRPRTLAMMHSSNSKVARKPVEQLNEMLRIQRLEPITSRMTSQQLHHEKQQIQKEMELIQQEDDRQVRLYQQQESEEEPEHQHDPLMEQQLLSMTNNWTFGEGESSSYDSDEPRDVARQRAQTEITYGFTPSVDDSSSEEPDDQEGRTKQLLRYQEIDTLQDKQQRHFYGTSAAQRDRGYAPQLHTEDHPALRSNHRLHRTLFWSQCFHDKCKEHIGEKHDYQFYPRRHDDEPIHEIYSTSVMIGWTMVLFEDNLAVFRPSPQFPMRCQHDDSMKWDECQQDECQVHYQEKARTWRIAKNGPRPPQVRIRENSLAKARREGKQITYPGQPEQSKN
ncbi:Retrotransposon-derived protein PEG10 [Colletotrichum aenigma]|uniref:Retrotransposon-derived protein PEG10 n=1 Tax=Colletotrichum aenigma TaxID=1215731 RepID=UPI001872222F|nr:Retrotransposon-derived protein PEG10 [Colletotrichum aenigma]XP_037183098.1 Retrotransposon-derived protein PEG10 [Colletotrichum aenigma]XP_037183567.1 Retrotransposon-derived protein PEG10 [Colletotrichum aenigma]KAF5502321.1 Retrotransposon-derived protein PEG10 [Colletotrichum aenigma]KAF5525461.1 Retrotransposon-derived protein PEG10 [Colletotrichum aenigma]KAF5525931.1 Retrotransposon-derived protein PEG10 [Colletotrichum aenigma]